MPSSKESVKIEKLKAELRLEKFKSNLFASILASQLNVKVDDFCEENNDTVNFYNIDNGKICINIHDCIKGQSNIIRSFKYNTQIRCEAKNETEPTLETESKPEEENKINSTPRKPSSIYRSVKNKVKLIEEKPVEQEEKIKKVEEAFDEIVHENFDVSLKLTTEEVDKLLVEIKNSRVYKKYLLEIKQLRNKLLGKLNLTEYTNLIKEHVKRLDCLFQDKKYDAKKRIATIAISLSPLDQRLIFYTQYYNTTLEPDEIQKLQTSIKVNMSYLFPKRFVPFSYTELYDKLLNYALAIYPVRENLKRTLVNPFGFPNLVFLQLEKEDNDPYTFYILEKIEKDGRRCWKMEIRLDDFSRTISQHMKTYCITLFRKIYLDIFADNIYREDYQTKTAITQQDCEQLFHNIIILSKPKEFCILLQTLITKHCSLQPSPLDKFNLTGDDKLHKKTFNKLVDSDDEIRISIKRMFDNITNEQADNLYLTKK